MSFIDSLLGSHGDPTADWKAPCLPIPDFDMEEMRFGELGFGDSIETAAFLGRPDRFNRRVRNHCELLYASGGFQIDFDEGGLSYLAFFIGPDGFLPKHGALRFSNPRLQGLSPGVARLSSGDDRASVERLFGKADSADVDEDETICFLLRRGIQMEFEFDGKSGRLKRWSLYPE